MRTASLFAHSGMSAQWSVRSMDGLLIHTFYVLPARCASIVCGNILCAYRRQR